MQVVKETIDRAAPTDVTVLVWGESGVGKEVVVWHLHQSSTRRNGPFVKVNCAALPLDLLESELFGYERGAFTGAHRAKPGKFELADGGTMFLDEIGEMPLPLQAKLLQVLQDGAFARLGSRGDIRVDVRIVASTNRDLAKLVESGAFRQDLYYRLNVVNIWVPPLRARREEIPDLIDHFRRRYAAEYGRPHVSLSPEALAWALDHDWPGNVRELENLVKRIVVLGREDGALGDGPREAGNGASGLPHPARGPSGRAGGEPAETGIGECLGLREVARRAARDAERIVLREVLDRVGWNRVQAAQRLRVSYKTLLAKIRDCGLER